MWSKNAMWRSRGQRGLLAAVCLCWMTLFGGEAMTQSADLQLTISSKAPLYITGDPLVLVARFKNVSQRPLKLLAVFEPTPVFFSIDVVDQVSERPLQLPGAGKIDFFGEPKTQTLAPGEEYTTEINVQALMTQPLKRGIYDVSVVYHNQYGTDAVKGKFPSNTVRIRILDKGE